jgi:hypothetical protein
MVASYAIVVRPVPCKLHLVPNDADKRHQKSLYEVDWFRMGIEV